MDVDNILQATHRNYQGDVSYPLLGDDDYSLRFGFLGDSIYSWSSRGSEENIEWKELFTNLTVATDGDKTAIVADTTYSAPTDFDHLTSRVSISNGTQAVAYYDIISPDQVMSNTQNDSGGSWCYVTGNEKTGYIINIPNPVAGTIEYNYYKTPYIPTLGTHKPEMRRPYYIVHDLLSKLFELDGRNDLVTFHEGKKKAIMDSMIIDNELLPFGNSNQVADLQSVNSGVSWGQ